MAERLTREQIAAQAQVYAALPMAGTQPPTDRTFELPDGLYTTTVAAYLGFVAVMGLGFGNPGLALPLAIFAFFIVAGFSLPLIWTRLAPQTASKAKGWGQFAMEGVDTGSGRSDATGAAVQVLILPVLIFAWGIIAVTIAALV